MFNTKFDLADLDWFEQTYTEKLEFWLFINKNTVKQMKRDEFINTVTREIINTFSIKYLSHLNKFFGKYMLQDKIEQRLFIEYVKYTGKGK